MGDLEQAVVHYREALALCRAVGERLMTSRAHHALASLEWERGELDQALEHVHQALKISQEIGYGPGIAHGLISLSDMQVRGGSVEAAREHLQEAMVWLRLIEDQDSLDEAQARLRALESGALEQIGPSPTLGWVKSHVVLTEGKVYCEFESPLAQHKSAPSFESLPPG